MDPLSHLVTLLDPRGRMELRCLFGAAFAAPHDAIGPWRAPFHVVLRGECELWLPESRRSVTLRPGSLLVLPRGAAHTLRASASRAGASARIRTQPGELVDIKTNVRDPARADIEILCGEFEFRGRRRSALLEALPECLVVEFAERPEFGWLQGLLRMMAHEIAHQDAGAAAIVAELSGAVFTLAVRAHLETQPEHAGVLGLMANARLAPALAAMLESPGEPWTVETLAARCHLSRAAFARLFAQHARSGPLELLTSLRMELASRLLAVGEQDTATIGEAVGYRSEAAFNRAFARHAGMTPGRFRRGERAAATAG
ncbi:AraC family transcriptional regulator [Scleromatobacter humisilvae]|uniref:AraC family transcriptional regulator n=1 Tax=Scleromatobacter humisilvae TaxID=2897159 RepID=A0A9X2C0T2_9BURK|nr:AraC family transcriptional regulator [Scleromatobacter humisilvae]MCK9684230.1 AraC family transcriptional regulator [Scleromatobacter humisilvae]